MLAKLNRIADLGLVFGDFRWAAPVPAFRSVNLIYGWNGCGKTTLTRLFEMLAGGAPGSTTYEVEDDQGRRYGPGEPLSAAIRVFNQDYVAQNVIVTESRARTISVLLGEANQELSEQISADRLRLNGDSARPGQPGLRQAAKVATDQVRRADKAADTAFTDIARTIGAAVVSSGAALRTYRAPDAKRDFAALTAPLTLPPERLERLILSLRQEPLSPVGQQVPIIQSDGGVPTPLLAEVDRLAATAAALCARSVESESLRRLAEHPDLADWVGRGVALHEQHGSTHCEYCAQLLPPGRVATLLAHFTAADRELKSQLDWALAALRDAYRAIQATRLPDPARVGAEFRPAYEAGAAAFTYAQERLLAQVAAAGHALTAKKGQTNAAIPVTFLISTAPLGEALARCNESIAEHDAKSEDFQRQQANAVGEIKAHYLSSIKASVDEQRAIARAAGDEATSHETEIATLERRVAAAEAQISSAHKACEDLNACLSAFLGRGELSFQPISLPDQPEIVSSFQILRCGAAATHLSEGEKTAIGFVYFVVHLRDGHFAPHDGIVVVDDPISSFDSASLYQAFSFLKHAVRDCRQVFILTHSFEFLRLLLNWRQYEKRTGRYMITNKVVGEVRAAEIVPLDPVLQSYETEYHYLFKRLAEMQDEQDGSIAKAYPVPNMARKLWDSFLAFRVPNSQKFYKKMDVLKEEGINPQKLDTIYKFVNDQSHITGAGFDPALVPEAQRVITTIFEVMAEAAPDHFRILQQAVGVVETREE